METEILITIGIIFLLLICSAFFSSGETALMGLSKARMHNLEKDGNKSAQRVNGMTKKPETLLSTILLGNNLVNIGASALATGVLIHLFGDAGIAYATLIMTFLVLIFAEVIPKTLANKHPNRYSMFISIPMMFLIKIMRPFTWFIETLNKFIFKMLRVKTDGDEGFHQSDVKGAIGLGLAAGVLENTEYRMLDSILALNSITVESVMIHRSAMEMLDANASEKEVYKIVSKSTHSRFPVWAGEKDNIIGFLHSHTCSQRRKIYRTNT